MTRPLSPRERQALDLLLSAEFPGVAALREQAECVMAERQGMVVDLVVPSGMPEAAVVGRVPAQAIVDGDGYDGGLLLYVDQGSLSALEYWWVTEEMPDVFPPASAIGPPIAAGYVPEVVAIAAEIERQLPAVKAGSLSVYGDVFGGRVDNVHFVVGARADDDGCLVVDFNGGESLRVWEPEAVTVSDRVVVVLRASRVRWEWYFYGRPHTPENRYFIEHVRAGGGVRARTNAHSAPHDFAPSLRQPAVELLGHW